MSDIPLIVIPTRDVLGDEIDRLKAEGSWIGNMTFKATVYGNGKVAIQPTSEGAKKMFGDSTKIIKTPPPR